MNPNKMADLEELMSVPYPYIVVPDDGEDFVEFPDLDGCFTQVERTADIRRVAEEIKTLWLEAALNSGYSVPEKPSRDFSGRFVVRIPKSLHRDLAAQAKREEVSLNSFVMHLLSARSIQSRLESMLTESVSETKRSRQTQNRNQNVDYKFSVLQSRDFDHLRTDSNKNRDGEGGTRARMNGNSSYDWSMEPVSLDEVREFRKNTSISKRNIG